MNRFLLTITTLALAALLPLAHADTVDKPTHSLVYGSSVNAEIDPCG